MKNTLRIFAATTLFSLGAAAQAGDPQITSGAADCTSIDDVAARNACLVDQAATAATEAEERAQEIVRRLSGLSLLSEPRLLATFAVEGAPMEASGVPAPLSPAPTGSSAPASSSAFLASFLALSAPWYSGCANEA